MTDPAATTAAVGPAVEEPKSTTRPYRIYNVELDLDPNQTTYVSFAELETEADREHATTTAAIVAEQPKMDEAMADSGDVASGAQTHFGDDSFYAQLLKNAQNYELSDEDEGDEEEESSRQRRKDDDNYDFNDPFIDDADAINMGVRRPRPKGVDGFFVWRGPLPTTQGSDGEDTVDKDALDTKRASGKAKAAQRSSSTATMLMEIDSVATTTATT
ncbi:hypothetical protein BDF22DRAFT_26286 [Syncephalis plumigaleata]|nr:hypothetical protein BDF22DRAFT_26286 [Syncephalis plumigaleata]